MKPNLKLYVCSKCGQTHYDEKKPKRCRGKHCKAVLKKAYILKIFQCEVN